MDIPGISSSEPITSLIPEGNEGALGKDAFLQLLVTQMRSQDPLDPASNEDMIAQLAEFSALEEMQNLNDNILGLAVLQQNNALLEQLTSSSALIGRTVTFVDPLTGSETSGEVESVKISEEGIAVLKIDGEDVPLVNVTEVSDSGGDDTGSDDSNDSDDDDAQG